MFNKKKQEAIPDIEVPKENVSIPAEEEVISEEELNQGDNDERPIEEKEEKEEKKEDSESTQGSGTIPELDNKQITTAFFNLEQRIQQIEAVLFRIKGSI